ncbi:MAG: glycosyltransferase family 4 protein, partial [Deltaproteobacteria bacterium]|nr:glycosyltransferase family 4 protein [Deltaproteobacteria bacterium]
MLIPLSKPMVCNWKNGVTRILCRLRIAIDASPLSGRIAGIGRYVLEICRALDKVMPDVDFVLYSPKTLSVEPPSWRWQVKINGRRFPSSYLWLKTTARAMAESDGVQVFWATRTILPKASKAFRTVSTVHDINYVVLPKSMPFVTFWVHKLWLKRDLLRADKIVANSEGTAGRLRGMFGLETDAVVRPGVTECFRIRPSKEIVQRLRLLDIRKPYFLTVGTVEPRKNLAALIMAFISLKDAGELQQHNLLIVGSHGWRDKKLRGMLAEMKSRGVRWLGYVNDEDLAVLYAGATALVFPSLYEGFGIPAAEARACGTHIVATDIPELREAGGPNGIYI